MAQAKIKIVKKHNLLIFNIILFYDQIKIKTFASQYGLDLVLYRSPWFGSII